jgi:hypothetical protein
MKRYVSRNYSETAYLGCGKVIEVLLKEISEIENYSVGYNFLKGLKRAFGHTYILLATSLKHQ